MDPDVLDLDEALADLDRPRVAIHVEARRYGKPVTVIEGVAPASQQATVARELKRHLATGGSVKDGRIELQGDHRRRARDLLLELRFPVEAM